MLAELKDEKGELEVEKLCSLLTKEEAEKKIENKLMKLTKSIFCIAKLFQ